MTRRAAFLTTCAAVLIAAGAARAEVPAPPAARGREFRVDFSARHLDVDADLGELSLSGDVEVTVGRYRLGGQRVRLKRGPRGIGVEGGGDIAFCSCDEPPITLGYRAVTIAPPSDVLVENAVLRAGGVPVFWLPYLWLRSPDRVALIFPSAEWRGEDGLMLGSGLHLPFEANQGRPAPRALDLGGFAYVKGGARLDARLLTPGSTTLVRWDYRAGTALGVDAHGAGSATSQAIWAYDVDSDLGPRGRRALSSLEAAARRYDHARLGLGSSGDVLFALGAQATAPRGATRVDPFSLGPFALVASGGALGDRSSYSFDLGATSALLAGQRQERAAESRGLERASLESAATLGPMLVRGGAFEQSEVLSGREQSLSSLRAGAAASVSLPLLRRFASVRHAVAPVLLGRVEREYRDGAGQTTLLSTAGVATALGRGLRDGAARLALAAGFAGTTTDAEPVGSANLGVDYRSVGLRGSAVADLRSRAAEGTLRLRLGARGGTALTSYVEGLTPRAPRLGLSAASDDLLPGFSRLGAFDRTGVSAGTELSLALTRTLLVAAGADFEPNRGELLALRSSARYRHACGCVAVSAFAMERQGRGGFDAGLTLDLMP